jgi:hypothetical protein
MVAPTDRPPKVIATPFPYPLRPYALTLEGSPYTWRLISTSDPPKYSYGVADTGAIGPLFWSYNGLFVNKYHSLSPQEFESERMRVTAISTLEADDRRCYGSQNVLDCLGQLFQQDSTMVTLTG